ncbi:MULTISPECIES: hypothetical protein [Legionella]|uniref:Uncharacterized protein n=1 Tax=Legionella resiliens TaxID=2905958 RepID=A0ABS8X4B0_9GAMM|nr:MULTISPECIES: hypothetical protein [unclassified Legionella]MCE0722535.1 hypothetical protein [Legionella sp. 9fVS26]MCE3531689.1 hypothetical protein [Legionella sp. 8cVS16]QLZ67712.1 hypothetical protein FOLKNPGA_00485 [Legionella sp. PC1000]
MWKKGASLKGGSSFFIQNSSRRFSTAVDYIFKLDSNMWSTSRSKRGQLSYLPMSYGGSVLTPSNALWKLRTLAATNCLARTMSVSEFDLDFPLFEGTSAKVPTGLRGHSQLVKFLEDGTVDEKKTTSAFKGHHKQTGEGFEGSALSFSHQWTIYHFCTLVSGKTSIVLADQTVIPDNFMFVQGAEEEATGYDPSGSPDTFTFEHEVTVQDVPLIAIPGRLHRQGINLVFSANPYFIDLKNNVIPEEIKSLARQATQSYLIASAIQRTGKPIPGHPYITMEEAAMQQKKVIAQNISVLVETFDMTSKEKDTYYVLLQEARGQRQTVHYTRIEVEEEPKEQSLEAGESTVKIEEITDEEAEALEKSMLDEDTGPKIKS